MLRSEHDGVKSHSLGSSLAVRPTPRRVVSAHAHSQARVQEADAYLAARTGTYEFRCQRYRAAAEILKGWGLDDTHTVMDVGAGWTEFDACLRIEYGWKGRYIPVDACVDGRNVAVSGLPRTADFIVCLELIEHLHKPLAFLALLKSGARGVVLSTPNPATTDVLAMDSTHKTPVREVELLKRGFQTKVCSFFGNPDDSILASFLREPNFDQAKEQRAGRWPARAEGWDD